MTTGAPSLDDQAIAGLEATDLAHLLHPQYYAPDHTHPVIFDHGEGVWLTDVRGRSYIDGLASLWNVAVGHGRAELADVAAEQMRKAAFTNNYTGYSNVPAIELAEKLTGGAHPKDALGLTLLTMDYERDHLSTPRIAAVVPSEGDEAWLGVVRADGLQVQAVRLEAGAAVYVATYEASSVTPSQHSDFDAADADEAARFAIEGGAFAAMTHPVASAAALAGPGGFALGTALV